MLGSRRQSFTGWAAARRPLRAARTLSFAASSCLLDAMRDRFPGGRPGKPVPLPARRGLTPLGGSRTGAAGNFMVMPPVARGFEFKLTAEADNVPIVRRALYALLAPAGFGADRVASIALATTEVCANVVRHAYPGGNRGIIRVEAELAPDGTLTVVVGDHGVGVNGGDGTAMASAIGLGISAAIADDLRIETSTDVGTEVRMRFDAS
jgi:anti-sigma regulatory factor (Ser/Thr protein kinase)